jgi:hypothetical protein
VPARWRRAAAGSPATVATYLASQGVRLSAGALARRAAAITAQHRAHGLPSPASDPAVTTLLRQGRRTATRRRAPPPAAAHLIRMATACPSDLAGLRDRALLLLAATGLGRSALGGAFAAEPSHKASGRQRCGDCRRSARLVGNSDSCRRDCCSGERRRVSGGSRVGTGSGRWPGNGLRWSRRRRDATGRERHQRIPHQTKRRTATIRMDRFRRLRPRQAGQIACSVRMSQSTKHYFGRFCSCVYAARSDLWQCGHRLRTARRI